MDYWFSANEIALMAAELEVKGAAFYERLRQAISDRTSQDVCAWLAAQEERHAEDFRAIAAAHRPLQPGEAYAVDIRGMLSAAMGSLDRLLGSPPRIDERTVAACLEVAADVEALSVATYGAMQNAFIARFADVLDRLIQEERSHGTVIRSVQQRLGFATPHEAANGDGHTPTEAEAQPRV